MKYRDPSGLAPEKEKHKDNEIMTILIQDLEGLARDMALRDAVEEEMLRQSNWAWMYSRMDPIAQAMMSGGSGLCAGSPVRTMNGLFITWEVVAEGWYEDSKGEVIKGYRNRVTVHYTSGRTASHRVINEVSDFGEQGLQENYILMTAYVQDLMMILNADPTFLDFTAYHDVTVYLRDYGKIKYKDEKGEVQDVHGLHRALEGRRASEIYLSKQGIFETSKMKYKGLDNNRYLRTPFEIIAHEFGHARHYSLLGDEFFKYSFAEDG